MKLTIALNLLPLRSPRIAPITTAKPAKAVKLLRGMDVPVPYLDTRPLIAASFVILGAAQPIAGIRQWFAAANYVDSTQIAVRDLPI